MPYNRTSVLPLYRRTCIAGSLLPGVLTPRRVRPSMPARQRAAGRGIAYDVSRARAPCHATCRSPGIVTSRRI